jgi:protein TonB
LTIFARLIFLHPMTNILLSIYTLISIVTFGQNTKKVVIENRRLQYHEEFYVLVDSPDVKNGEYVRTFKGSPELHEKGQFTRGKKTGIWTYTDANGDIEQEIDFSNQKVKFAKPFQSLVGSSIIKEDGSIDNSLENAPIFLGGQSRALQIIRKNIQYPVQARRVGQSGTVFVSAKVTKDGKLVDEKLVNSLGYGLDEESIRVIQLLPDEWLPAGWGKDLKKVL